MKVLSTPKLKGFYKQWKEQPRQPDPASAYLHWARSACWGGPWQGSSEGDTRALGGREPFLQELRSKCGNPHTALRSGPY